jgi:glycosyltransferase involved in cell wall biosynthesis
LIREQDIEEVVAFKDWMPYDEMLQYLDISDVGLAPFRPTPKFQLLGKGTNRKIFTYMSAGLPVVAPDFLAVSDHVVEQECGEVVDTKDPDQLASAIVRLLDDPESADEMGIRGRDAIESVYNWEVESEKLLEVYQNATA